MRAKLKIRGLRPENMPVIQEVQKNIENKIEENVSKIQEVQENIENKIEESILNLKIEIDNHAKDIRKIKEKIYKRSWIARLINKIKGGNII